MAKKRAPLFSNEDEWVNVTVECETCGDSEVSVMIRTLVDEKPAFRCPLCMELTGQQTTVEVQ